MPRKPENPNASASIQEEDLDDTREVVPGSGAVASKPSVDLARTIPRIPGGSRDPLIGQTIADRYRIVDLVGTGGMGAVYRGVHLRINKVVAIKVLNPEMVGHPEALSRFEREAKAAAKISHRNVCAATDFGATEDGQFFLVMEYVEGESLEDILQGSGRMDPRRAVAIVEQICQGLERAHDLGIVHRDLKPENIMIVHEDGGEVVKILDFGIAKITSDAGQDEPALTKAGAIYGTPRYMAPEQIVSTNIDARADLYSVGVILFRMLTGVLPFDGQRSYDILQKHLSEDPPSPRAMAPEAAISLPLNHVVLRLLSKRPEQRFQSAGVLREALLTIGRDLEANVRPPGPVARWVRRFEAKSRGFRVLVNLIAVLLALVGVGLGLTQAGVVDLGSLMPGGEGERGSVYGPGRSYTPKERQERLLALSTEIASFESLPEAKEALANLSQKRNAKAISLLERMRQAHGTSPFIEYELGRVSAAKEDWSQALKHYEFAIWRDDRFIEIGHIADHAVSALVHKRSADSARRLLGLHLGDRAAFPLSRLAIDSESPGARNLAAAMLDDTGGMSTLPRWKQELIRFRAAKTCKIRKKHLRQFSKTASVEAVQMLKILIERGDCGQSNKACYGCLETEKEALFRRETLPSHP